MRLYLTSPGKRFALIGATFFTVLLLIALPFLIAPSYGEVKVGDRAPPGSLNAGAIIPDSEIPQLKLEALHGSGKAARRLSDHYEFGVYDPKQAAYWAQIGAENRDPVSEFNYGTFLQSDPDPMMQIRATYWRNRAKKDGDDPLAPNKKPQGK